MATYKEKVGTSVVNYAGNYPGAVEGELWYDSTNNDFKYQYAAVTSVGAWSTGGDLNEGRLGIMSAINGTQNAALGAGGNPGTGTEINDATELYDGTSWTEVNNLNLAREDV